MPKKVLFLCTGNYYRSRFAEALFNHRAAELQLEWTADSRALAIEKGGCNVGPISPFAREALKARGVQLQEPLKFPAGCLLGDFETADRVIALKEAEHRSYMNAKFPTWSEHITYWHVHDLDLATPDEALGMIEKLVAELIDECRFAQTPAT